MLTGSAPSIDVAPLAVLFAASPEVTIWSARVTYDDGTIELYQLPLVERDSPAEGLEHVLVGSYSAGEAVLWLYDALHDKDVTQP